MSAARAIRERRRRKSSAGIDKFDMLAWMLEHRQYLAPYRKFDLESHKYLIDIYNCRAHKIVLYKAAQMGISEYMLSCALFGCARLLATGLYVFPTESSVSDFATERLGPAIDCSKYLTRLVVAGGKRGADRVKLKRIGNRFLYFRGSKVTPEGKAPQLKSIPADQIIVDEVDECDPRAIPIVKHRLDHSDLALERYGSTPSYEGVGIHAMYEQTDKRLWMIPCPACKHRQNVTIENVVTENDALGRPQEWYGKGGKAYPCCEKCNRPLDLSVDGEWVAEHPHVGTVGFHVTKFAAPWVKINDIIESLRKVDETERRESVNQSLGLPYQAEGLSVTEPLLKKLRREYGHGPRRERRCYMGVDVGSVLHVIVREEPHYETGDRRQLHAGTVVEFEELHQLIETFKPAAIVCDALPETRKVRETQQVYNRGKFWACYYPNMAEGTKGSDSTIWARKEGTVNADRTRTLDETVARFINGENTLPLYIEDVPDYIKQVCAPKRVVEMLPNGKRVARYVGPPEDHYMHAENYATIASLRKPMSQIG